MASYSCVVTAGLGAVRERNQRIYHSGLILALTSSFQGDKLLSFLRIKLMGCIMQVS